MSSRRRFWLIWGLIYAVAVCTAVGTPLSAGPDEWSHLVRSAGLVRGDVFGSTDGATEPFRTMDVPAWVAGPEAGCFAFQSDTPADCAKDSPVRTRLVTNFGTYPVWSYVLPGLATLLPWEGDNLWLARLADALLPTLFVAAAVHAALRARRPVLAAATLLATTPMTLFLIAVVNPSGMAVGGAVAAWVGADLWLARRSSAWLFVLGSAAMALPRSDGLLWWAVLLLAMTWWHRLSPIALWHRLERSQRGVVAGFVAVSAVWVALVPPELIPVDEPGSWASLAQRVVGKSGVVLRQAVGVLGWLDTPIPDMAFALWLVAVGVLVGVALAAPARHVQAIAFTAAAYLVIPWAIELSKVRSAGLFWQGRYGLGALVGVVILLGSVADSRTESFDDAAVLRRRVVDAVAVSAWVVWNLGFAQQLRRWGVGAQGSMVPWRWDTSVTPFPALLVLVVHAASSAGLVGLVRSRSIPRHG